MAKPGSIVYSGAYYENVLKTIFDDEEEEIVTSELLEDVLKHGMAYELHYVEEGKPEFVIMSQLQGIPVYSTDLKKKLIEFLYFYCDEVEEKDYIWDYDEKGVTYYVAPKGSSEFVLDTAKGATKNGTDIHGYGQVPVNVYCMARDCSNLFDHARALIDEYDRILSEDFANELERFANAYLLLASQLDPTPDPDTGESEVDLIKRTRVISKLGDEVMKKVGFLVKPDNGTFSVSAADRFERLIYEMLMIFNPSDEKFTVASGIAMAYKILAFEYNCTSIQTWFSKGLQNRIELISTILKNAGTETESQAPDEVQIDFKRNLPFDLSAIATVAMQLTGTLSQETILGLFPKTIVPDVKKEIAKVAQEKADNVQSFMTVNANTGDNQIAQPINTNADPSMSKVN